MRLPSLAILSFMLALLGVSTFAFDTSTKALAQDTAKPKPKPKAKRAPNPDLAQVEDQAGLPRVLLIGDSISMGYTLPVREALAGKANVHRPPANCGPTSRGVEMIDSWLGDGRWDVIHFNFGLHDLRQDDKGVRQVPLEDYKKNLRTLIARLKKTGATLIWCSTTPVPEKSTPVRTDADVVAYNEAARALMAENGIAIDDLYSFALPQIKQIQRPDNVHFTPEGSKVLARQVASSVLNAIDARRAK